MKIMVVGQPMSGVFNLKELLAESFSLEKINLDKITGESINSLMKQRVGMNDLILSGHFDYSQELFDALIRNNFIIYVVTRDPYKLFQATYQQVNSKRGIPNCPKCMELKGLSLHDSMTIDFAKEHFREHLDAVAKWISSYGVVTVHMEAIESNKSFILEQLKTKKSQSVFNEDKEVVSLIAGSTKTLDALESHRLPLNLVQALNASIPKEYQEIGYELQEPEQSAVIKNCLSGFSTYISELSQKQHVFIVGNGKSGTTWLHLALFHHPNTVSTAERRLYEHPDGNVALFDQLTSNDKQSSWFESSSFGKNYPEQTGIHGEIQRVVSDYLTYRAISLRMGDKGFRRSNEITHITEKIALTSGEDASVTISGLAGSYPDAKILHIVRDPRDVAISSLYHIYRDHKLQNVSSWVTKLIESGGSLEESDALTKRHFSAFCNDQAKAWSSVVKGFHLQGESLYKSNYIVIRYEDLLKDPEGKFKNIMTMTGLADERGIVDSIVRKTSFSSLSQGRQSGDSDLQSFYRKGVSGDWKNHLNETSWRKLFAPAVEMMNEFDYSED